MEVEEDKTRVEFEGEGLEVLYTLVLGAVLVKFPRTKPLQNIYFSSCRRLDFSRLLVLIFRFTPDVLPAQPTVIRQYSNNTHHQY